MSDIFTSEQVQALWKYQFGPWPNFQTHPFTCPNREDHPDMAGDKGVLVPTVRGFICPFCDYTQTYVSEVVLKYADAEHSRTITAKQS